MVSVISLVSLVGVLFLLRNGVEKDGLMCLVSLSVGGLFGGAFLHLLPESLEIQSVEAVSLTILSGILSSYFIEMLLKWRHCHIPSSSEHPHTFAYMNLIGDGIHNFIDGMVVAGAFLSSMSLGYATSIAILLHEVPQEIGDFGVLLFGGIDVKRALAYNLLSGLTALAGAVLALLIGGVSEGLTGFLLPFALGNFVYIAGSDLVPELQDEKPLVKSLAQLVFIMLGVGLLYMLKFI
jgi:zinc and cadmium transporter